MYNKKRLIITATILIALSSILYVIDFLIFRDPRQILLYIITSIAFIPLEIFIVTFLMESMLEGRERNGRMKKMNMLIGLYFQEFGLTLLKMLVLADEHHSDFQGTCAIGQNWKEKEFNQLEKWFVKRTMALNPNEIDYDTLTTHLVKNQDLLVSLIANPTLLEHETFSELLMAVSHLKDEMALRNQMKNSAHYQPDLKHWKVDLERVYKLSAVQWIHYIAHLQSDYPFLYNAARVTNPFEEHSLLEAYAKVREQA